MRIHRHRVRRPKYNVPQFRVNEQIKVPSVRVIDQNGSPLGELPVSEAMSLARAAGFDLVEVSPKAEPPVCRFLDYSSFRYQKEKEARKQKAQSKDVEVKGIRLSLRIGPHDSEVRLDQASKFFERGDKVRLEIVLRGREKAHADLAKEVMEKFTRGLGERFPLRVEQTVNMQAGRLTMILARQ